MYVCVRMYVCMYTHVPHAALYTWQSEESSEPLELEGGCELPGIETANQTQVLYENSKHS